MTGSSRHLSNATPFNRRWVLLNLLFFVFFYPNGKLSAQEDADYDEIAVVLTVPRVGAVEISAAIRDEQVYLPVNEFFDFLKIRNKMSVGMDSVSGFFIQPKNFYLIDYTNNRIVFQGVSTDLSPGSMIRSETNLYLHSRYFGQVFGLHCTFNFRSLGVMLDTRHELPIIREMRLEQMRQNINKLKGEVRADTVLPRSYPLFHFGNADWSVISSQTTEGRLDTRVNLGLGAVIAGGETNISLLYDNNQPFREKQQQYLWRYANNDFRYLRQVMAGKIASQATSSIYAPVVGVQLTNTPTSFRRSFGSYTLSDRTEPGWTVELYVNNVLVDYTKADASGFFSFEVPLVYGNSAVLLKFYGPWGEERTREQNISIPFNFLPKGELQYTASAGIVEDTLSGKFARVQTNYGLSSRMTIGAGTEYLSTVSSGAMMPFVSSSLRLASSVLISGEYTHGVRTKGILSYRMPSNLQFELNFTQYEKNQKAINYNYLQERKAVISIPLRTRNFSAFSRLTLNQIILPESEYTTAELLMSGAIYGISTNLTTYAMFIDPAHPYAYSNLSLSFRLPASIVLIPQMQYEFNNNRLISLKCGLEKHLFRRGFINVSYERNYRSNLQNIEFGFRYDFSFAQTAFTARKINDNIMLTQSARGSVQADRSTRYLRAGNRTTMGRGGVVIIPFLDLDCDGRQDAGEPRAFGLSVHTNGGRMEINERDSTIRIFDLEPYSLQYIEFDKNSFDNIAWQLRKPVVAVTIDPNQFRKIEVPIAVVGEASGMVYLRSAKGEKGLGRIIVNFINEQGQLSGRVLSESDGYFSFLGLPPGKYTATVDSSQLRKVRMRIVSGKSEFRIEKSADGDVADDLEIILESLMEEKPASSANKVPSTKPGVVPDKPAIDPVPVKPVTVKPTEVKATANPGKESNGTSSARNPEQPKNAASFKPYAIQCAALSSLKSAREYQAKIEQAMDLDVAVVEANKLFKVVVRGFSTTKEASDVQRQLENKGFGKGFIIRLDETTRFAD